MQEREKTIHWTWSPMRIGVIFGVGAAQGVTVLLGFPSSLAIWSIFAGLLVATSVGLFFGVYPARKAAALNPIDALRYE